MLFNTQIISINLPFKVKFEQILSIKLNFGKYSTILYKLNINSDAFSLNFGSI